MEKRYALCLEVQSLKVKALFDDMPASWQKRIIKVLQKSGNEEILKILK